MKAIACLVFVVACGGSKSEPASYGSGPSETPPASPTSEAAPGGVPGTPVQCCCELPDSRGMQLQSNAECSGQAGTCKPETECTAAEGPK